MTGIQELDIDNFERRNTSSFISLRAEFGSRDLRVIAVQKIKAIFDLTSEYFRMLPLFGFPFCAASAVYAGMNKEPFRAALYTFFSLFFLVLLLFIVADGLRIAIGNAGI